METQRDAKQDSLQTFVVLSTAGANRDLSKGARDQAHWDEHEGFIDNLVDRGFIVMGGPLVDEGGGMLIVRGESAEAVRATMEQDPWYAHEILCLVGIKRWDIFIDKRT
jgi:uncharacterized protein YciI